MRRRGRGLTKQRNPEQAEPRRPAGSRGLAILIVIGGVALLGPLVAAAAVERTDPGGGCRGGSGGPIAGPAAGGDSSRPTLAVAHESGRSLATLKQALGCRADVVEVDLVAHGGQLYVSHDPLPAGRSPKAPTLRRVWAAASAAPVVEFDLKDASPAFRALLVAFLAERRGLPAPQVFVASRDVATLRLLRARVPDVFRFLSIGAPDRLASLYADPVTVALLDGVSIRHDLVDRRTVAWFHARGLLVFAWTVNSPTRVQALLGDGVDGITTDRGAIVRALVNLHRGDPYRLRRAAPAATAARSPAP